MYFLLNKVSIIFARVEGLPIPFSFINSRKFSSSTCLPAVSAAVYRHGRRAPSAPCSPGPRIWCYGLGSMNRNLPSFVVLAPQQTYAGAQVWASDFLPAEHQGTWVVPGAEPVANIKRRASSARRQELELAALIFFCWMLTPVRSRAWRLSREASRDVRHRANAHRCRTGQ